MEFKILKNEEIKNKKIKKKVYRSNYPQNIH